jgi:hypothetical protein
MRVSWSVLRQARLRRRTAEKMQQQRMLTTTPQRMLNN